VTDLPPIRISAAGQVSEILVRPGLLDAVGGELRARSKAAKACVFTDGTVAPLYLGRLTASLGAGGFQVIVHTQPAGEQHKLFETLPAAYGTFLSANIDRGTPLIALGGGVVGDMAGFVAATLLRGVPFVQVPTTLMAMVDSSIGGKTGVNHAAGKNLIGAFHQPIAVLSDPELLRSLPEAEVSSGLAECIKHDLIRDAAHFAALPGLLPKILARDVSSLAALVRHNASIKAAVVNEDPFEKSVRAHLNLGHTFGHAIEVVTHHAVPHGNAVSLGIACAARLSERLGILSPAEHVAILATLQLAGLPVRHPGLDADALIASMARDKKVEHGKMRFVVLNGIGQATVRNDIPESEVRASLAVLN
jgi:3-dehydroquinate synthase